MSLYSEIFAPICYLIFLKSQSAVRPAASSLFMSPKQKPPAIPKPHAVLVPATRVAPPRPSFSKAAPPGSRQPVPPRGDPPPRRTWDTEESSEMGDFDSDDLLKTKRSVTNTRGSVSRVLKTTTVTKTTKSFTGGGKVWA